MGRGMSATLSVSQFASKKKSHYSEDCITLSTTSLIHFPTNFPFLGTSPNVNVDNYLFLNSSKLKGFQIFPRETFPQMYLKHENCFFSHDTDEPSSMALACRIPCKVEIKEFKGQCSHYSPFFFFLSINHTKKQNQ